MTKSYKIKWTKFLYFIYTLTLYCVLLGLTVKILIDGSKWKPAAAIGILLGVVFIYLIVLHVVLFFNYYKEDKDSELIVSKEEDTIQLLKKGKNIFLKKDEISKISIHHTLNAAKRRKYISTADYFSYSQIYLSTGDKFVITCLLCENLEIDLPDVTYEYVIRRIPVIQN